MRKIENWEELRNDIDEVISFDNITAGQYICKIIDVEDVDSKEYLKIWFDIVKGDFVDAFKTQEERTGQWPAQGIMYWSYKASAQRFYASKITAIEKSNDGYKYKLFEEDKLKGKYFVANFGEEEYLDSDNELKVGLKVQEVRSLQALKEGKIKTPKRKELSLEAKKQINKVEVQEDDLPF